MATLRILSDDGSERVVELRDRKVQIGRGRDNDIVLPDSQKGVSRTHAELRYENGHYIIVDLQSQNGTWLNGQRVERAEVPNNSEITVGEYRLRLQHAEQHAAGNSSTAHLPISLDDIAIRERTKSIDRLQPAMPPPPAPAPASKGWATGALIGAALVVLGAAAAWMLIPATRTSLATSTTTRTSGDAVPSAPTDAAPLPSAELPPSAAAIEPTSPSARRPDTATASTGTKPPAARRPGAPNGTEFTGLGTDISATDLARVRRKPGESAEQWRVRGAGLHTRYAYSKQALERHDYTAAASGFEAILIDEPGFLDAPQLLVQAYAGLRVSARDLFEAGNRLDAVGDWMGALQKYEQARLIAALPGLPPAIKRVRDKLQLAGAKAFTQARLFEASGRSADAVKEYEKAFQWLSPDDPNREVARARVDQLKRND